MTKYLYTCRTWRGNQLYVEMMNDINQLGQEGWKIIQMIESPWMNGLTEITVFFEYAYFQEND